MSEGVLVLCATPIGNLSDVSDRLREVLSTADVVYAEDTRRTATLLRHIGAKPTVRSLFAGNEKSRTAELMADLDRGLTVAVVSDAGMPTISDPGAEAVSQARERGHRVTVVPGPSAVVSALALSGFGADRFVFEGFLPRKGKERAARLDRMGADDRPAVFFVSPHRLIGDLESIVAAMGSERSIAITRELTKLHEEVWTGTVGEALQHWADREVKGELTVVVGPGSIEPVTVDAAVKEARTLVAQGATPSDAARSVASSTGVSRREIYETLIRGQEPS
jgi:16S rRNA (cytidine1402-2'-O)-methyltransferase